MKLLRPYRSMDEAIEMAPMIDIVFLLLIFFMVGTTFRVPEKKMMTELPREGAGAAVTAEEKETFEPVRIFIRGEAGALSIQCNDRALGDDFVELRTMLRQLARVTADLPVIIDATPRTPLKYIIRAMDLAKAANLHRISFSAGSVKKLQK